MKKDFSVFTQPNLHLTLLHKYLEKTQASISVVDPNTLNLDPDPGFWPNLDPDPGLFNQFWKKKLQISLEKHNFLSKKFIFKNYKNKCHVKKFWLSWVSELWIYILILKSFVYILCFILYFHLCGSGSVFRIRIRIQKAPIRIRIHNTGLYSNTPTYHIFFFLFSLIIL